MKTPLHLAVDDRTPASDMKRVRLLSVMQRLTRGKGFRTFTTKTNRLPYPNRRDSVSVNALYGEHEVAVDPAVAA